MRKRYKSANILNILETGLLKATLDADYVPHLSGFENCSGKRYVGEATRLMTAICLSSPFAGTWR